MYLIWDERQNADLILAANAKNNFFAATNVVFEQFKKMTKGIELPTTQSPLIFAP
ncbi:hypothetical protein [Lucifera butyrica]|uniref:hypothetical protein n=1 Tax=Lucifera butyrica TaxID=1351585 RepID=UPI001402FDAB|nr:hypothetical protein [Lucifera butyrica]